MSTTILSTDTLTGTPVRNAEGEDLGEIKELMIDARTGHVAYAVLSFGGFLGFGDKLFSVPFQSLHLDTQANQFTLDIDRERLEDAPGFDKDDWPEIDYTYLDDVYVFYGVDPYWNARHEPVTAHRPAEPAAVSSS